MYANFCVIVLLFKSMKNMFWYVTMIEL